MYFLFLESMFWLYESRLFQDISVSWIVINLFLVGFAYFYLDSLHSRLAFWNSNCLHYIGKAFLISMHDFYFIFPPEIARHLNNFLFLYSGGPNWYEILNLGFRSLFQMWWVILIWGFFIYVKLIICSPEFVGSYY